MKIALTVGHSLLKNGCYTGATGKKYGGCNEYKWCKAFSKQVAAALRKNGHIVHRIVCPEKSFLSPSQERPYKLDRINAGNYDLVIELHLNAPCRCSLTTLRICQTMTSKRYVIL